MGLVLYALKFRITTYVLAVLMMLGGLGAIVVMPKDVLPVVDIPVVVVVWTYTGLSTPEMETRVTTYAEFGISNNVNNIRRMESTTLQGTAVQRIYFDQSVSIDLAIAQVVSSTNSIRAAMPPGIQPPVIVRYSASSVPVIQLALSSASQSLNEIYDYAQYRIRQTLAQVPGSTLPAPFGGAPRQIMVDLDLNALQALGLTPLDVTNAMTAQNLTVPSGLAKIGEQQYPIQLNATPPSIETLNTAPIKVVAGQPVLVRDVAFVRDGGPPQINVVRADGSQAVLMQVIKNGNASTLSVVNNVKAAMPTIHAAAPEGMNIKLLFDQSVFVSNAIEGVLHEAATAAALTGLAILLFLGSWRSTVIIAASIPLAILAAVAGLAVVGQTLNIMTLGGLALAVGILVDDATVTIENINWHLEQGKSVRDAILDGAQQIVQPAFVSLLCICIAFLPMFFLPGIAGFLFAPMAMAVVFAMIASFILSRTLVPTMGNFLLREHATQHTAEIMVSHDARTGRPETRNVFIRFQSGFEHRFEAVRAYYVAVLAFALARRRVFILAFMAVVLLSFALVPMLGRNFFPTIDAGQINLHVRAPIGTRIEETAALFDHVEDRIRATIPADELVSIVDNIGMPVSGINRAYSNTGGVGSQDGDILVTLAENHKPTADYVRTLRKALPDAFPGSVFSFLPADIISQILNFGAPAPIDVMVTGSDAKQGEAYAHLLAERMRHIPGIADVRVQQTEAAPELGFDVDRAQADRVGITENDVTRSLAVNLAGSSQIAPAFWLNPKNGVSYPIVVQTPQYRTDSLSDLQNIPITGSGSGAYQILGGLGTLHREPSPAVVTHYALQQSFDVYATTQGRDLGAVAGDIQKVIDGTKAALPSGSAVTLRGQVRTMNAAFSGLIFGLIGAIALIYLLIVVNFQSWVDPAVIVSALPAALAGIVWMLFATHTPLSVPALTGAIMCMGVATANSVLVVSFARERLAETGDALRAAAEAGATRFRPVLMTALAMIIGMAPMALGLGEGGEQNAPLGRAVIGGLICATLATLVFVPVVFAIAHRRERRPSPTPSTIGQLAHG